MIYETSTTRFQIFINLNLSPILNHITLKSCLEKRHIFLLRKEKSSYNKLKKFSYAFRHQLRRKVSLDYVGTHRDRDQHDKYANQFGHEFESTHTDRQSRASTFISFSMIEILIVDSIKTFTNSSKQTHPIWEQRQTLETFC